MVAALILLALTGLTLTMILRQVDEARALMQRIDRIILITEQLLSDLKDVETGQRGYLLTGNPKYLEPYDAAQQAIDHRLTQLVLVLVPAIRHHLPRLRDLTQAKRDELALTVGLRQTRGSDAALSVVQTDSGKQIMDAIRAEVAAMAAEERNVLEEHTQATEWRWRVAMGVALLSSSLACLCAALSYHLVARRHRSHRQHAERARDTALGNLESSEVRFQATFDQAVVGIAHVGLDGRWLRVNDRLCTIVGWTRAALLAGRFQDITHPDDLGGDEAQVAALLRGDLATYSMEKRYLRQDGTSVWVNLTASLVRKVDGSPDYFISVLEDISARKAAEMEIRRLNEDLEQRVEERTAGLLEANRQLDAFAHTVFHDLRGPLRAVEGFTQAAREDLGDGLLEAACGHLQRVMAAAERMDDLIGDVLAYSQLQQGQFSVECVDLDRLLWNALADLGAVIQASGAEVNVARPLPVVLGNATALRQVVENLLTNAVKFVAPGTVPRVRVWAECRPAVVRLWIEDNGIGVAPEHQSRIFQPFERLHGADAYEGSGVGLGIVWTAIGKMGGRCGVVSSVGAGSRFWIELPEIRLPNTAS
ncbi:CHASE3 domain-containing protein [Azospirillum sp. A29]|uniref:sensor histidine kinase n=1 Tax=Azospirillum sp. A29 TaxID=3160606 RepID=UPI00366BFA13